MSKECLMTVILSWWINNLRSKQYLQSQSLQQLQNQRSAHARSLLDQQYSRITLCWKSPFYWMKVKHWMLSTWQRLITPKPIKSMNSSANKLLLAQSTKKWYNTNKIAQLSLDPIQCWLQLRKLSVCSQVGPSNIHTVTLHSEGLWMCSIVSLNLGKASLMQR